MPRYIIVNPNDVVVPLPPPLQGRVGPRSNYYLTTEAVNVDTPHMQALLDKSGLKMAVTYEAPSLSDHIEIPVVDMLPKNSIRWRGLYNSGTAYEPLDAVQYNDTTWLALQPSEGIAPSEGLYWTQIGSGTGGGTGFNRTNVILYPIVDPRLFTTPELFSSIEVFDRGGRHLVEAATADPRLGDYYVAKSSGSGAGFDQVRMLTFSPRALVVNYQTA